MSTFSARQTILLVMLFVLTSITFLALDNRSALDPLKSGVHSLVAPAFGLFDRITGDDAPSSELERQYAELEAKYDALQADYAQAQVVAQEVDQLRAALQLQQDQPDLKFVSARVLYPDPLGQEKFVIIDKGSADGIKVGMAVTDPNFYVGLVTQVDEDRSRVALAIDVKQSVGAQLLDTQAVGIAWGMWQLGGRIDLRHVDRGVTVKEGDWLITACRTEAQTVQVPCGLKIGVVNGPAEISNQGDSQTIPILPAADFGNLSVVAVITSNGQDGS